MNFWCIFHLDRFFFTQWIEVSVCDWMLPNNSDTNCKVCDYSQHSCHVLFEIVECSFFSFHQTKTTCDTFLSTKHAIYLWLQLQSRISLSLFYILLIIIFAYMWVLPSNFPAAFFFSSQWFSIQPWFWFTIVLFSSVLHSKYVLWYILISNVLDNNLSMGM